VIKKDTILMMNYTKNKLTFQDIYILIFVNRIYTRTYWIFEFLFAMLMKKLFLKYNKNIDIFIKRANSRAALDTNLFNIKEFLIAGIMILSICLVFNILCPFDVVFSNDITPISENELTWEQLTLKEQLRFGEVYWRDWYIRATAIGIEDKLYVRPWEQLKSDEKMKVSQWVFKQLFPHVRTYLLSEILKLRKRNQK
jgi:hypothetical protein